MQSLGRENFLYSFKARYARRGSGPVLASLRSGPRRSSVLLELQ
jgi:hypothetical protein